MPHHVLADEYLQRVIRNGNLETQYGADDFVNPELFEPHNEKQKAWVFLDGGFTIAIVFAEYPAFCEQDALDAAVDSGKLDRFRITAEELSEYETGERVDVSNRNPEGYPEYDEHVAYLGNAGEPHDIESLYMWTVPASTFAEDTALMTFDRVRVYLENLRDEAERVYGETDVYSGEWSAAYRARENARDAVTLARFAGAR